MINYRSEVWDLKIWNKKGLRNRISAAQQHELHAVRRELQSVRRIVPSMYSTVLYGNERDPAVRTSVPHVRYQESTLSSFVTVSTAVTFYHPSAIIICITSTVALYHPSALSSAFNIIVIIDIQESICNNTSYIKTKIQQQQQFSITYMLKYHDHHH